MNMFIKGHTVEHKHNEYKIGLSSCVMGCKFYHRGPGYLFFERKELRKIGIPDDLDRSLTGL